MKRNWDTIREILLKGEELEFGNTLTISDFDEIRAKEIEYHVKLLKESNLIKATVVEFYGGGCQFDLESLTWSGHDFLDAIRNDTIWNKTKTTIATKSGSMTFELIKSIAIELAKAAIGSVIP